MTAQDPIAQIDMFSELKPEALEGVRSALQTRELAKGEVLFNLGDPGDELIIVIKGELAIYSPIDDDPAKGQAIRVFTDGEVLGEMALLDQKPRSLSARAEKPSTIFVLKGDDFHRLVSESDELATSVMQGLSGRIRYTTEFLGEVQKWVRRVADGGFKPSEFEQSEEKYTDQTLKALAGEFARMASQVHEREETLRREVAQLRIEIDEKKRKQDVSEITSSDYYQDLKAKIRKMREENAENA
jgi:CRP/FNR family transcriptional regulator